MVTLGILGADQNGGAAQTNVSAGDVTRRQPCAGVFAARVDTPKTHRLTQRFAGCSPADAFPATSFRSV
jgi:hypothetical protein